MCRNNLDIRAEAGRGDGDGRRCVKMISQPVRRLVQAGGGGWMCGNNVDLCAEAGRSGRRWTEMCGNAFAGVEVGGGGWCCVEVGGDVWKRWR